MNTMLENCKDNLRYYYELEVPFIMYYRENIYENLAILDKIKSIATKYKRNDIRVEATDAFNEENARFYPYFSR
jgi:hypothetical protein